jgi:hypothetical protein
MGIESKGRECAGVAVGNMESSCISDWLGSVYPGNVKGLVFHQGYVDGARNQGGWI